MPTVNFRISNCFSVLATVGIVVCSAACGSAAPVQPQIVQQVRANDGVATRPAPATPRVQEDADHCVPEAAVHFAFDSTNLDSSGRDKLAAAAACMRQDSDKHMTITGMTDPRGTEEYNLALGERRAQVTAGYLTTMGVESNRIAKRSYGEEHARGQDESSWSHDRRAEISVQSR